ncbi:MAG: hypothetical protein K0Q71_4619 [Thermomicrobiales bacterium]|nr:hypothetical protein [Thermomicrobiales bacterium]
MPRALQRRSGSSCRTGVAMAGRMALAVLFGLGLLVPALGGVVPVAAQATSVSFSTAEAAPADSLAYLVLTLDDESEQWRLADVLLDRAGLGEALDEEISSELQDEAGEDLPLDAFLGGEVGIVVSPTVLDTLAEESMASADLEAMLGGMETASPEAESTEVEAQGFALALEARAPDTAWTGIRESVLEEADHEESTYEGTEILYAPPATAEDEGMATARVGDLILIATVPEDLHPLIDTADGRTEAITTVPEFTAVRDELPTDFLMFAFTNSINTTDADFGPFAMFADQFSTESFTGLTIAAAEPGFRMETATLAAEGETLPAAADNFESELVNRAPEDSLFFTSAADLGATGVLDVLGATIIGLAMGMGDPSAMPDENTSAEDYIAEQYEAAESLIGINLQTALFQQLSGEYGGWLRANLETEDVSGVFASGVEDAETVSNALMQLSFLIQGATGTETPLTTREVGGGQVYVIELGDEAGSTVEFGIVGDYLVVGKGDAVDRFGDGATGSLADNAQFQAVMDTLPVEHNGLTYIDLAQALPLMEVAAEESDELGLGGMEETPDASESCGNYATQEEAQTAYDAAESGTFDLDQDFDGEVCEDFFAGAGTDVEETKAEEAAAPVDALADVDYSAIKAFAVVTYADGEMQRSSSILYITE